MFSFILNGLASRIADARRKRKIREASRLIAEIERAEIWLKDYGVNEMNRVVGRTWLADLRQQLDSTGVQS